MNVFEVDNDDRFQAIDFVRASDWVKAAAWFRGQPVAKTWKPLPVEVLCETKKDRSLPPGDFPALGGTIPVFSRRAIDCLKWLSENGELLPLKCRSGEYFAYNVLTFSDGLDEQRSLIERLPSGIISFIDEYVFDPNKLADLTIFKLSQERVTLFATDGFVSEVKRHGLKGFTFDKVWHG